MDINTYRKIVITLLSMQTGIMFGAWVTIFLFKLKL